MKPGWQSTSVRHGQTHLPTVRLQRWARHCASDWHEKSSPDGNDSVVAGAASVGTGSSP